MAAIEVTNALLLDLTEDFLTDNGLQPMIAGDTVEWRFQIRNSADVALSLTGAKLAFAIRETATSTTNLLVRTSTAAEIEIDADQSAETGDTGKGWFTVVFAPADEGALAAVGYGRYFYDIRVLFADGTLRTYARGRIDLLRPRALVDDLT